jgi:predicted component of type VI protein secretion system
MGLAELVVAPTVRSMADVADGCLVCVNGEGLGRVLRVDRTVVIGRGRGDLALASTEVSRDHARIVVTDHGYILEDLDSANGTYLDGVRVTRPTPIRFGAHIQIGRTIVLFTRCDDKMAMTAGGLAHDFANALAVIVSNLEPIEETLPAGDGDAREALAAVRRAATTATDLVRRLQRFGGR